LYDFIDDSLTKKEAQRLNSQGTR